MGGEFDDSYKQWFWCIKRNGDYININEYLLVSDKWEQLTGSTLDKIKQAESE